MFLKIKNNYPKSGELRTKITKSTSQSEYEKQVNEEVNKQASICPECGRKNEVNPYSLKTSLGYNGFGKVLYYTKLGSCSCGAEWDVDYNM